MSVHPHLRPCLCLVVHVCATTHLPTVLVLGPLCGLALSELGGIDEHVQFPRFGLEYEGTRVRNQRIAVFGDELYQRSGT
jgi:hypothetical protein